MSRGRSQTRACAIEQERTLRIWALVNVVVFQASKRSRWAGDMCWVRSLDEG